MRSDRFALLVFLLSVPLAMAQHWDVEKVDSAGWGANVDMRWHPDGRLFLCYSDTSGVIRLASKDSVWSYEDLPQWRTTWSGTQGFDIGRYGDIGVSYVGTGAKVWYALKTHAGWADIETPFSIQYSRPPTALDTSGAPVISLEYGGAFLLARMRDTSWASETLATGSSRYNYFGSCGLGSLVDGTIWGVFEYYWVELSCDPYGVKYYSYQAWDSGVSVVQVLDAGMFSRTWCSSGCVDQHGVIHACCAFSAEWFPRGTYLDQTRIDSAAARIISVRFDSLDRPQIAYITLDTTLMYRYLGSGVWHIFDLQTTGVTALSLIIGENSQPLIAYRTSEGVFLLHGVDIVGQSEDRQRLTAYDSRLTASVIRNVLILPEAASLKPQAASLLDASGRKALDLRPGANDVSGLSPGVYFVREAQAQAVRKVVITR